VREFFVKSRKTPPDRRGHRADKILPSSTIFELNERKLGNTFAPVMEQMLEARSALGVP
jgi:hypothetical protein